MNLFERFEVLEDPRDIRGKKYKLIDIIIMTIYGLLFGLKDFVNIADYMELNEDYFKELLGLENGTPSHDCLSDIFARIDCNKFMNIFIEWTKDLIQKRTGKKISIDGKAVKSATDKINGGNTPYIVSAFIGELGLSIGQVKVDDKSNEITAIPDLLDLLDIEDSIVTIDAIGTQEDIVNKIVHDNKAHYVLKVKKNQKELLRNIKSQFNTYNNLYGNEKVQYKKTIEKDHGRGEIREYFLIYDTDKIKDKDKWKTVNSLLYVKVQTQDNDEIRTTDNYYIIDYKIDINTAIETVRDHWSIECGLHWKLDVIFDEDHSRNHMGNSINNLSILRKIVFNLVTLDNSFGKITMNKKLTRYKLNPKNIENLIFNVIPSIS